MGEKVQRETFQRFMDYTHTAMVKVKQCKDPKTLPGLVKALLKCHQRVQSAELAFHSQLLFKAKERQKKEVEALIEKISSENKNKACKAA